MKHFIKYFFVLTCCWQRVNTGWLNGYIVEGDENRNIAFETLPDLYLPTHINQSNNLQSFNYILNIFLLKDAIITEKEQ